MTLTEAFEVFAEKKPETFKQSFLGFARNEGAFEIVDHDDVDVFDNSISQDDADLVLEQFGLVWWCELEGVDPYEWGWFTFFPIVMKNLRYTKALPSKSACASAVVIAVAEWLKGGGK